MKKLLIVILVILLLFLLSACSPDDASIEKKAYLRINGEYIVVDVERIE